MHHSYSTSAKLQYQAWLLPSFISSFLISLSFSDPRISESGLYCGKTRPPPSILTSLIPTFVKEMDSLSQAVTNHHFATFHKNSTTPIFALAQCHQDLSQTDCLLCYAAARTRLPRCLPSVSGSIFLDGCFLRYDNYSFYQEAVSASLGSVKCSNETVSSSGDVDEKFQFVKNVGLVVENVTRKAVENGGFGVAEMNGVYALAQCWQTVGREGCGKCLEEAAKKAKGCGSKKEGRGMDAGCYLRYSTEKFYSHGDIGNAHGKFSF